MGKTSTIDSILIFNSKFEIKWIDQDLLNQLGIQRGADKGLLIYDLFPLDRFKNKKIGRWLLSGDSVKFSGDCEIFFNEISIDIKLSILQNEGTDVYAKVKSFSLNENEVINHWDTVIKTFPGALIILNSSGVISEITSEAIALLQLKNPKGVLFSRESLISKKIIDILSSQKNIRLKRAYKQLFDRVNIDNIPHSENKVMLDKNLFVRLTIAPVITRNKVLGHCLYLIDESESVLKEIEIHNQRATMISSSKLSALGEMASGIAHEINNPLTVIKGTMMIVQKMLKKELDEEVFNKIDIKVNKVLSTVSRASKIIAGLRAFSSGSNHKDFSEILLTDVLDDVLNLCNERLKFNRIEFFYENNLTDALIKVNSVQISQVLINLINNSVYEIREHNRPFIKLIVQSVNENKVSLSLIDSGRGIPFTIREKIFEPFYTTKEVGKGTGLGLSISYQIILDHQGDLLIDDKEENTCFKIVLPITQKT